MESKMKSQKVPSSYRILRLRSGQDIITRIKGKRGKDLIIERPMQMQVKSFFDGVNKKDILMFNNWLQFSREQNTTIPRDWIAMFLTPELELVDLYNIEKSKEDILKRQLNILEETEDPLEKLKIMQEILKSREMDSDSSMPKEKVDYSQLIEPNTIMVNLAIPSEIFFQMISEGLLENFDLDGILGGEVNNEDWTPTKEPDDPDYGKDWQDWSPDPDDYV
jgi:hypothetical protein